MLVVKNPLANATDIRDSVSIPGLGRSPGGGHGNPLQILAWRIPWTEEPGGLYSIGSWRVRDNWSNLACTSNKARQCKEASKKGLIKCPSSRVLESFRDGQVRTHQKKKKPIIPRLPSYNVWKHRWAVPQRDLHISKHFVCFSDIIDSLIIISICPKKEAWGFSIWLWGNERCFNNKLSFFNYSESVTSIFL